MNRRTAKELEESHKKIFNAADKLILKRFDEIEDHILYPIIKLKEELMQRTEESNESWLRDRRRLK